MKKLTIYFFFSVWAVACQWEIDPQKQLREDTAPVVETGTLVGTATTTTADVQAKIVALGFNTLTEYGIVYAVGNTSNLTTQNSKQLAQGNGSTFTTVRLSGLTANTSYSYRAYAINNRNMIGYGEIKTFRTDAAVPIPEIVGKISVSPNEALVMCQIANMNAVNLSQYGIVYVKGNTTPILSNGSQKAATTTTGAATSFSLTGLSANTLYSCVAYAIYKQGLVVYSNPVQFTTQSFGSSINVTGRFKQDNFSNTIQLRFVNEDIEVYGGLGGTTNPDGIYRRTATDTYTYVNNPQLRVVTLTANLLTWYDGSGGYFFRRI